MEAKDKEFNFVVKFIDWVFFVCGLDCDDAIRLPLDRFVIKSTTKTCCVDRFQRNKNKKTRKQENVKYIVRRHVF